MPVKYMARMMVQMDYEYEADSTEHAAKLALGIQVRLPSNSKLLGVVRAEDGWPSNEADKPVPPKGRPPSGTPGTPTLTVDQVETTIAVAA